MCVFQELCNKIHSHKLEKHESISHIMHEESAEGNDNMGDILLEEDNDEMNEVLNQYDKLQSSCEN